MSEKKLFYKMVCDEFPGGLYFENRRDAIEASKDERDDGIGKAYVRAVKITQEEIDSFDEI